VRAPARDYQEPSGTATDRELAVVAAVIAAGSEKAAAHRLGLSHSTVKHQLASARSKVGAANTAQLVWILGPRLPRSEDVDRPKVAGKAGGPRPGALHSRSRDPEVDGLAGSDQPRGSPARR
jgi:DNA-binding CsgD family transcriptional regulator